MHYSIDSLFNERRWSKNKYEKEIDFCLESLSNPMSNFKPNMQFPTLQSCLNFLYHVGFEKEIHEMFKEGYKFL